MFSLVAVLITEHGKGTAFISELKKHGISEGISLRGEGTVDSEILKLLNLNYSSKDVIVVPVSEEGEKIFYDILKSQGSFIDNSAGIAFSIPLEKYEFSEVEQSGRGFSEDLVILITDNENKNKALSIAREKNVRGGTMLTGRGAGVPKDFYFPITIEPEKLIFLFLVPRGKPKELETAFVKGLKLTNPGAGMLFVLPVAQTIGLNENGSVGASERTERKKNDGLS